MTILPTYIKQNVKSIFEDIIYNDEDFKIDTSKHSEERYYIVYHKEVSENDLKIRLAKLKNRLIRLFYIDKEIDEKTGVIIIDKSCKPNFVIICALKNTFGKLKLTVVTEIFKDNFKKKNDKDYVIETYI